MTLSRWQPFGELSTMKKQMDRLFVDGIREPVIGSLMGGNNIITAA